VQLLQEAKKTGCLEARLAVEALPRPDRKYYRDDDPLPEAPAEEGDQQPGSPTEGTDSSTDSVATANEVPIMERRADTPTPELFRDGIGSQSASSRDRDDSKAGPGEVFVDPAYAPKSKGLFDKLNPFSQ
jgi:hypothetical protein